MAKTKKKTSQKKSGTQKKQAAAKRSTAAQSVLYVLTPERRAELEKAAAALGNKLVAFPGRVKDRVRWSQRIATVASRDVDELVQTPFHGEPALTRTEIVAQRDRIELMRLAESEYQAARAGQATASKEFAALATQAAVDRELLLRAFDVRFRNEPRGQKRVSQIRAGAGDADLVQDVSDVLVLANEEAAYIASCPRGEPAAVTRLQAISPELSRLLGAKTITEEARKARRLRDAAFTLVTISERRIRAAADYWYGSTEKMKEYGAFPLTTSGPTDDVVEETGEAPVAEEKLAAAPVKKAPKTAKTEPAKAEDVTDE